MQPASSHWVFNLSPYIFEVQNIPFGWVKTWYGVLILLLVFGGGFMFTYTKQLPEKWNVVLQNLLAYGFVIFCVLFGLQKFHVSWGLRWYSVMYIIGFAAVYLGCLYWSRKKVLMITESQLVSFITFTIIGMLIGARLTYVFVYDWDMYKNNLWSIFATWQGGLSFHGGIVGVILSALLFTRLNHIPFLHMMDKAVRMIPIGIGCGRIGNFMNGELWGRESNVPWAIIFPGGGYVPRHPSQLYQSLGEGWLLFFTLYFISRRPRHEGTLSACFVIFYCVYRFFVEYFRAADAQVNYFYLNHFSWAPLEAYPQTSWWLVLTMGQILCIGFFIFGLCMYAYSRHQIMEGSPAWLQRNEKFFKRVEYNK